MCSKEKKNDSDESIFLTICDRARRVLFIILTCSICLILALSALIILGILLSVYSRINIIENRHNNNNNISHGVGPWNRFSSTTQEKLVCSTYRDFMRDVLDILYKCHEGNLYDTKNICSRVVMEDSRNIIIRALNNTKTDNICIMKDLEYVFSYTDTDTYQLEKYYSPRYVTWNEVLAELYQDINIYEIVIKTQKDDGSYKDELKELSDLSKIFRQHFNRPSQTVRFKPFVVSSGIFNKLDYTIDIDPYTKKHKHTDKIKRPNNDFTVNVEEKKYVDKFSEYIPELLKDSNDIRPDSEVVEETEIIQDDQEEEMLDKLDTNNVEEGTNPKNIVMKD